jgi:H2-forming N5,N10-methylenetetrahydromethanopterin dehydrogenase-like enzyme
VIVRLDADGAVVADADDCSAVHVQTPLEQEDLRAALLQTGTGSMSDGAPTEVVLDIAVLRSRAALVATTSDWVQRFEELVTSSGERLTDDGLGLRVAVERPPA